MKYASQNKFPRTCETRFFSSATQVKPCRVGLRTGWVIKILKNIRHSVFNTSLCIIIRHLGL